MSNETAQKRVAEALSPENHVTFDGYFDPKSRLEASGAAIAAHSAWLWEQAERPEVVDQLLRCIPSNLMSDDVRAFVTKGMIEKFLTALLGPRKEPTDDN